MGSTRSGVWGGTSLANQINIAYKLKKGTGRIPNAEFSADFRWDHGLGTRSAKGTFYAVNRQARAPHAAHERGRLVHGQSNRRPHCMFYIRSRVIQLFVDRSFTRGTNKSPIYG